MESVPETFQEKNRDDGRDRCESRLGGGRG